MPSAGRTVSAKRDRNSRYALPDTAKSGGRSRAAGRYHASACPSLSWVLCAPCRCTTWGTGPRYRRGLPSHCPWWSRCAMPPAGLAQCRVGIHRQQVRQVVARGR